MIGTVVNPVAIRPGDEIAIQYNPATLEIKTSRKIKKVGFCSTDANKFHLDHECYDTRFSTVVKK